MPAATQPVASPTPRRRGGKGEQTAERILDVAESVFAEHGFAGATLRDVAAGVGLRNPSLYNHFDSKEALYAAVLERGIGPILAALSEFVEAGPAPDSRAVVRRILPLLAERPSLPRLLLQETLAGGRRLTPLLERWIMPAFERAHRIADATPGARRWQPDQIPLLVLGIYHMVVGYFTIAPLYEQLFGEDLLADAALARQTRFLEDAVRILLPDTEAGLEARPDTEESPS
jgi:AcrR family transcriptional regulator